MLTAVVLAQLPASAELEETVDVSGGEGFEEQLFGKRIVRLLQRRADGEQSRQQRRKRAQMPPIVQHFPCRFSAICDDRD